MRSNPSLEGPAGEGEEIGRITAMSWHGLTVDWEDNGAFAALSVDGGAVIGAIAGQGKSFPQNIRVPTN
jgi:hypothetical protein